MYFLKHLLNLIIFKINKIWIYVFSLILDCGKYMDGKNKRKFKNNASSCKKKNEVQSIYFSYLLKYKVKKNIWKPQFFLFFLTKLIYFTVRFFCGLMHHFFVWKDFFCLLGWRIEKFVFSFNPIKTFWLSILYLFSCKQIEIILLIVCLNIKYRFISLKMIFFLIMLNIA